MGAKNININLIVEGYSPRRNYKGKEELKRSIEKEGLLEPLLVRKDGKIYVIIAGNRRFCAVKELGWKAVECIIEDADEKTAAHLSYLTNSEDLRNNLNPLEVSLHIKEMREKFGYSVQDLLDLGYAKDDQTIYNKLNLLKLPKDVQEKIGEGTITPTEGYRIAAVKDPDVQLKVIDTISGLKKRSVRKTERIIKNLIDSVNHGKEGPDQLPQIPEGDIPRVFFHDASDMSELADESVSLVVTSPPYGVGMEYEEGVSFEGLLDTVRRVFSECNRVLVPGGKICIDFGDIHNFGSRNGGKPEIKLMGPHYQEILGRHGLRLIGTITWKKCTPGKRDFNWSANPHVNYHNETIHTSYRILNNTEHIYIFEKDGEHKVPFDIECESKISKEEWKERVDSVWEIPPVRRQKSHPAQFPEEIPRRLIKLYSYKGDIVLDCFGGSMTTIKVANELGRIGIGYEKEEKYKPAIMRKLGLTEEDLKKPEVEEDRGTQGGTPHTINEFEGAITDILAENNKTSKDIVSVRVPFNSSSLKDDIEIDWVTDDEEPDPSGPTASPQLLKADDYEGLDTNPSDSQFLLPERCSDISPQLNKVLLGDCLEKLKDIPDDSVDVLATDPPYGIKFMGKNWDKAVPTVEIWKEVLRVLKPGAFAFVMSIPRQDCQSRMISNLEEAGFKVDFSPIYWTYAQGFPKAYNISKGIEGKLKLGTSNWSAWKKFEGSYAGFQPKPAVEVIIVAMKPMDEKTYVGQALKNGKGITWIDDCRIPYKDSTDKSNYDKCCEVNGKYETGLTWGGKKVLDIPRAGKRTKDFFNEDGNHESWNPSDKGRFPANLLVCDDVLDDGKKHPGGGVGGRVKHGQGKVYGFKPMGKNTPEIPKDSGGYSRFFSLDAWAEKNLPFLILPKPSKREKGEGNNHPTVKPMKLMSYLITMGSREQDVVLDIFAGSGSTCIAAKMLNRKFIGIELDEEYQQIAEERIENATLAKAA